MNESTKMVMVLVIVSLLSATSLSIVYEKTKGTIENNKLGELKRSLNEVIPGAEYFKENEELNELISDDRDGIKQIFDAYGEKDDKIGMVLLIDTMGFQATIRMLAGVDNSKTMIAVKILEHLETPGLGERITEPEFLNQFKDRSIEIESDDVDAITGATISSAAVIKAVTENVNKLSKYVAEEENEVTGATASMDINSTPKVNLSLKYEEKENITENASN